MPVSRSVARIEQPSVKAEIAAICLSRVRLFMGTIHVCGIAPEVGIAIFISTIIASGGQSLGWWSRSRPPLARRLALLGRGGGGIRTHGTLAPWKDLGVLWIVSPAR